MVAWSEQLIILVRNHWLTYGGLSETPPTVHLYWDTSGHCTEGWVLTHLLVVVATVAGLEGETWFYNYNHSYKLPTLTTDNRDDDEVVNHVVDTCHAPTIKNEWNLSRQHDWRGLFYSTWCSVFLNFIETSNQIFHSVDFVSSHLFLIF